MSISLGIDISTAVVGIAVFQDKQFVDAMAIVTPKKATIWEKVDYVSDKLDELLEALDDSDTIEHIYVEQDLQAFRPGFSSAKVLMTLAKMNGMVSYLMRQKTGLDPEYIDAKLARKTVGLKLIRKSKIIKNPPPTKEQIMNFVSVAQPDFPWEYKTLKSGPRKGLTVLANHANDMADAWVVGKAGVML